MILCIIGYLLCPPANMKITMRYIKFLTDANAITNFNWCEHVIKHMQQMVGTNIRYPTTDMQFVMVNFMDKVDGVDATNTGPTSTNWTKKELFTRLKNIENGCGFS
ncbi:hypothetical protein LIER_16572 [Lithospermum erythrorhizon]|uniref:Uncharacterized protein n=1 Tax=Lithospermum erythrorhizon TaxID=34254 RepID=A0AAV3Q810_LITER